jgi:hypothetical protein
MAKVTPEQRKSGEVQQRAQSSASEEIAAPATPGVPPVVPPSSADSREDRLNIGTGLVPVPLLEVPGMAILLTPEELALVLRLGREKQEPLQHPDPEP